MTQEEYQAHYEAIESECKNGTRSWVSGTAAIAMLSIEYGRSCERAGPREGLTRQFHERLRLFDRVRLPVTTHTRFLGKLLMRRDYSRLLGAHTDHVGVIWPDGTRVAPISGGMIDGQTYTDVRIVREAPCCEAEESKP